ncbi:MAG: phosphoribosylaminoimidazolesuccinocarboxamide synthase, partial [Campylobacteraceae bacterium]|nr:phosphoribosylaminoimidazolesuccinocarboxamide synthase [Campylobacteraceae bacterium]
MQKKELLYEGKGKKLYATDDKELLISEFKDDLTAFNAQKKGNEKGKGELNCKISTQLFNLLSKDGIKTHLVQTIDENSQLVRKVSIIPIEVVVRNIATGSLTKRLGIKEGNVLPFTLVEFYYKDDALGDPLVNDEHCLILNVVKNRTDLQKLRELGIKINDILKPF